MKQSHPGRNNKIIHVLVTGSGGAIGRLLIDRLSPRVELSITKLSSNLLSYSDLISELELIHSKRKIDVVIHLAGKFSDDEKVCRESNYLATKFLCAAMDTLKINRIIFTSSGSVYGNTGIIPVSEDFPLEPIDFYGKSKLNAERYLCLNAEKYKQLAILRLPSVYGKDFLKGVLHQWSDAIIKKKPILYNVEPVYRSFVSIENVIDVICQFVFKKYSGTFNVSEEEVFSLTEIIDLIVEKNKCIIEPFVANNMLQSMCLSSKSLEKMLGKHLESTVMDYLEINV